MLDTGRRADKIDQILCALQNGEHGAMEELYECTKKPLFTLCYSYFHNEYDSEDALYDSYMKIHKEINHFRGKSGFNWIYTITKNICFNMLTKQQRTLSVDIQDEKSINVFGEDPSSRPVIDDESGILALSKEILNETEFKIVSLHAVGGMKFKDIANILDKIEASVRWSYNNALKKLRKEFERRNNQ